MKVSEAVSEAYTVASSNGRITIALSIGNSGAGPSLFCYNIAGVTTPGSMSSDAGKLANLINYILHY